MDDSLESGQERSDGRRVLCGTVVLDRPQDTLQQRVANKLYESARQGTIEIENFPDYNPLVSAIQNVSTVESEVSYQVTLKRHDKLLILSALANKFLESDEFGQECRSMIDEHNKYFNPDGEFMAEPEQPRTWHAV